MTDHEKVLRSMYDQAKAEVAYYKPSLKTGGAYAQARYNRRKAEAAASKAGAEAIGREAELVEKIERLKALIREANAEVVDCVFGGSSPHELKLAMTRIVEEMEGLR